MWQRFTERARRVIFFAQEEANRLGENYVSTEHLLLGLVRENGSTAIRILQELGVSASQIRAEVERQISRGDGRVDEDMHLTPRAKRVIDLAYEVARDFDQNFVGTEHLLLGLIREGDGLAATVMSRLGVDYARGRTAFVKTLQLAGQSGITQVYDQADEPDDQEFEEKIERPAFSKPVLAAFHRARAEACEMGSSEVTPEHLLLALLVGGGEAGLILAESGLGLESLRIRVKTLQRRPENTDTVI